MTTRTEPKRIQRKRTKGWRMPEGAVYVGRPTIFGNPFRPTLCEEKWLGIDENGVDYAPFNPPKAAAPRRAVGLYSDDLTYSFGGRTKNDAPFREAVESLRGKALACWCSLDQPCHADV